MNTANLIEALLDPESYPHPVEVITTIETHISIVFLTGQYAYKLKKPVDFGFLDFSSLSNRKKFCELENTLNKRTAPKLYLGVFQIEETADGDGICIIEQSDSEKPVIDYLVKMQQFEPNNVLGRMLKNEKLEFNMVEKLAKQIALFHEAAEKVSLEVELGDPAIQLQPMLDNFPTLEEYCLDPIIQQQLTALKEWTDQQYKALSPSLVKRKQTGFVRACHGDLHLDNIAIIDNEPVLFDGIEFNEHFRWIDAISDLAFLLIDLDFRKQHAASYQALSLYLSQTLDYNGLNLLNFYRVYRTLVRAKITTLRAIQLPANSLEQQQVQQTARNYIEQATAYIQPNKRPKLVLMQGVSGSGKSYLANQMLEELDEFKAIVISSDRIRKSLYGISSHERVAEHEKSSLYSTEMNSKTYRALQEHSKTCLTLGLNVIVDATFLKQEQRQKFYDLADESSADSYLISIEVEHDTAEQAIFNRQQQNNNPSDADADVMRRQLGSMESPTSDENPLILKAEQIRKIFPKQRIQEYLELPIN